MQTLEEKKKTFNLQSIQHTCGSNSTRTKCLFLCATKSPQNELPFECFLFTFRNACVHVNSIDFPVDCLEYMAFAVIYPCVRNDCIARTLGHIGYHRFLPTSESSVCVPFSNATAIEYLRFRRNVVHISCHHRIVSFHFVLLLAACCLLCLLVVKCR